MTSQEYNKLLEWSLYETTAAGRCDCPLQLVWTYIQTDIQTGRRIGSMLLSFERPTRPRRTAAVPIICNYRLG